MGALARLPEWATTGVGSLPHDSAEAAVSYLVAAYDVPFCPQLPLMEGNMIREWLGADPGRCGWSPERDRETPLAWPQLLAALDAAPPVHGLVKLQVTGPATLALALLLAPESQIRGTRTELLGLARELATWVAANAARQIRQLAARDLETLLIVDEPALQSFADEAIVAAWEPLRVVAPLWGLHICCSVPWKLVAAAEPDVISFDLALEEVGAAARPVLQSVIRRGRRIAWGVLEPHRDEAASEALARLRPALASVGASGENSMLTASCGSGLVSVGREAAIVEALRECASACRQMT